MKKHDINEQQTTFNRKNLVSLKIYKTHILEITSVNKRLQI